MSAGKRTIGTIALSVLFLTYIGGIDVMPKPWWRETIETVFWALVLALVLRTLYTGILDPERFDDTDT